MQFWQKASKFEKQQVITTNSKQCNFDKQQEILTKKSYCLLITHLNGWNGRQYFSRSSPCFGFFVYPFKVRRTHYPTLENYFEILNLHKKPQQIAAACENQGNPRELSDNWKSYKTLLLKKKVAQLVKPINYWELVKPINYRH